MPLDPSNLSIMHYPAAILRTRCEPVPEVTDEVRAVGLRMVQMMLQAQGLGLAAPQVGLAWRMFVCHVPPDEDQHPDTDPPSATVEPMVFVNPVLSEPVGPMDSSSEGCLSLPGITGDVARARAITITALDLDGREIRSRAGGLLARCWQHETDHLDGVLILDRMSHLSRLRVRAAVRGLERDAGER
jgi:peptide deformylase